MKVLKSVGAVLAGFISVAVLSILTDMIMESTGIFPPVSEPLATMDWMLAIALAYRSLYTVMGGYFTAKLAPKNPMNHVIALMVLGGLGGMAGAIGGWSFGHHWYSLSIAITGPLFVWLGGKLAKKNRRA